MKTRRRRARAVLVLLSLAVGCGGSSGSVGAAEQAVTRVYPVEILLHFESGQQLLAIVRNPASPVRPGDPPVGVSCQLPYEVVVAARAAYPALVETSTPTVVTDTGPLCAVLAAFADDLRMERGAPNP